MRRLVAFIAAAYTIIMIALISFVPYIGKDGYDELFTDIELSVDYKGGYDILYRLVDENGEPINKSSVSEDAAVAIRERIDAAGIDSAEIYVEDNSMVRATVELDSSYSNELAALTAIQSLIESNLEVTFRDETGNLLATGDEMLDPDKPASVVTGQQTYVTLNLTPAGIEVFDNEIMEKVGTDRKVVVWLGYTGPDDHSDIGEDTAIVMDKFSEYEALANKVSQSGPFSLTEEEKISYNRYLYKILTFATISEDLKNQGGLAGTGQNKLVLNANYTTEQAKSIANMINSEKQDYSFEFISFTKIPATHGGSAFIKVALASLVTLLFVSLLLIIIYRLPGVAAVFTLIAHVAMSIVTFKAFGGVFGTEIIIALIVSVAAAIAAIITLFERINDEVYKGKSFERAYAEGAKKSNSTVLDFSILVLLASIVMFIFGERDIKSMATMLIMVSSYLILIVICLGRLLTNCIYKSKICAKHPKLFGINVSLVPDVQNGEEQTYFGKFTKVNFVKHLSKGIKAIGAFILVGILAGGLWWAFSGSPLNYSRDFADASVVTIQTNLDEYFQAKGTKDELNQQLIEDAIESWDLPVSPDKIEFATGKYDINQTGKIDDHTYVIWYKLTFSENLDEVKMPNSDLTVHEHLNEIFDALVAHTDDLNDNSEIPDVKEYCFIYTNNKVSSPVISKLTAANSFLVYLVAFAAVIVYVSIRFKYTYSLSMIGGLITDLLLVLSGLFLFRVKITIGVFATLIAIAFFSMVLKTILFDRIRENVHGGRKKSYTHDERIGIVNKATQQAAHVSLLILAGTLITALAILLLGGSIVAAECLTLILGVIASGVTTLFISARLWVWAEDKLTIRLHTPNANKKKKQRIVIDPVEEQVFIGIND